MSNIMDANVADHVKNLVSENKLEEALQLLIESFKESSDYQLNSLIILKGKLALLKEQEVSGLLEFDDLAREKMKIAHAVLASLSPEMKSPEMPFSTQPSGTSSSMFKPRTLAMLALLALAVVSGVYFLSKDNAATANPPASQGEVDIPEANPATGHSGTAKQYRFTTALPIGQPFEIGDVTHSIKSATIEKFADPVPPDPGKVRLAFQTLVIGKKKGTGGVSWREEKIRVVVDGIPYAPVSQKNTGNWIENDSNASDELEFTFDDNGKSYELVFTFQDQVHRFPFAFSSK